MLDRASCKHNGESEVKTSTLVQSYIFTWRLENFLDWPDSFKVTSHEFQLSNDIILYSTFERFIDTKKALKSFLNIISKGNTAFEIQHQLSIIDSKGKVFQNVKPIKFVCDDQNKISDYMIYSDKIKEFSKSTEDQIVIFKCTMELRNLTSASVKRHKLKSSTDPLTSVIKDFKAMYVDSLCTDFSLRSENSVLRVHKFVLCARSPVFAKMLKSPMEEKEKDAIEITDIKLSTLKTFVEYLYTGNSPADVDFDSWCRLYYAANKYDVSSLRETCADALLDKLDAENSCRILSLANLHSDAQFLDAVLDFMQCHFDAVMETESWFELNVSEPELTNRVMRLRVQKSSKSTSN